MNGQRKLSHPFFTLGIMGILIYPWYSAALPHLWAYSHDRLNIEILESVCRSGNTPYFFYSLTTIYGLVRNNMIGTVLFSFFLLGLFLIFVFGRRREGILFLLCWLIPPVIFFAVLPGRDSRYILPFLPVFALVSIGGIASFPRSIVRKICFGSIVSVCLIQFFGLTYNFHLYF